MKTSRRRETSAGGVVYRRASGRTHYLLIRDPYQNWGLPKGHVESGETAAQAARREVAEETGVDALELVEPLSTIDWYFKDGGVQVHKYCHFFLFEAADASTRPQVEEGISECVWLELEDALARITYDNAREILREAGRRLEPEPEPGS